MDTNKRWTLTGTTFEIETLQLPLPFTASLTSTAATRAIQITLNGTDWSDVVLDTNDAAVIGVGILAPVIGVRATGVAGDVLRLI